MDAPDDYLLMSGIQHFAFCRRQWALIHLEQLKQTSAQLGACALCAGAAAGTDFAG